MKLKRLAINRLPGINPPFEIQAAGAGFHVVVGPNGIGKSSLCRAVESLYWDDRGSSQKTSINGEFELDGEAWWGEREGSRVRWQRSGEDSKPPNLPASHNHRYFFLHLRDLIDPSSDGTQDIASEIRRQMSGGFDLDRIAADLFGGVSAQHVRRERSDFNKASEDVRNAEGTQLGLQRRADQLDILSEQLDAAESSARRLALVERALELTGRLQENSAIAEEIAILPHGVAKLTGNELEQIERFQDQIAGLNERGRNWEAQLDAARKTKQATRLSAPLDQAELSILRENANAVGRLELELQAARDKRSECLTAVAVSLKALGGGEVDETGLALPDNHQLFEFLRDAEGHRAEISAIEKELGVLAYIEKPGAEQSALGDMRRAGDMLRAWLRAPELQAPALPRRASILGGVGVVAVGLGLTALVDPLFAALAAFGAGLAVPALLRGRGQPRGGTRDAAQQAFARLGIAEPEAWDIASVDARLRSLEDDISRMVRARDRDVERQKLNSRLEGLSKDGKVLDERRRKLADSLRLDEIPPDAELVETVRSLAQMATARKDDERARSKVETLETRYTALLSGLADVFERHDEAQPADATEGAAYLDSLVHRDAGLAGALSDEQGAISGLEQVSDDRSAYLSSIERIYSEVSLDDGDLQGLTLLLNSLPSYRDRKEKGTRLEGQIELDRTELAKAGEAELAECDGPMLEQLQGDLTQTVSKTAGLRDEIAEINAQVKEAQRGSNVQDFIAVRDEVRMKLLDCRDEVLFAKAGKFLIDAVKAEYEQTQMPRVFQRARSHLSAFTRHGYELLLGKDTTSPGLLAIETSSGERRNLDELSDGTRAQLLLAARLAFAEEVEQGGILPLFLDEALDQSDPARFEAIVRSLGQIAKDQDRQIFYLTSDPVDVDRIGNALAEEGCDIAATIDVGLIRRNAASCSDPAALCVEPRPEIPLPDEMSAEDYGIVLGVPAFLPGAGHEPQHVFYVLSDALDQLRDFLAAGIERVGQWRTASDTGLAEQLCAGSLSAQEVTARVALLGHFCALWKQGRGRSVDRDTLEQSGAVSGTFIDKITAANDELGGDAERLLASLDTKNDTRLKGFRRNNRDSLESYLRSEGYLDDQPVLSESELRLQAMATPAANTLPRDSAGDLLHRLWTWATRSSDA